MKFCLAVCKVLGFQQPKIHEMEDCMPFIIQPVSEDTLIFQLANTSRTEQYSGSQLSAAPNTPNTPPPSGPAHG